MQHDQLFQVRVATQFGRRKPKQANMIRNKRLKDTRQRESPEWKLSIKLSPFFGTAETVPSPSSPSPKSSRSFDDGVVGLGIVAAMSEARSEPIPIVSVVRPLRQKRKEEEEEERMEMSESYTCVIAHVGKGLVRKRVYFDHGGAVEDELFANSLGNQGIFYQSPARPAADRGVCGGEFLSRCFLCRKNLHGLDIFMYRGERAFCSEECRSHQIGHDEQREKHGSETRKPPFNCSASPCSARMFFAAGLAAA